MIKLNKLFIISTVAFSYIKNKNIIYSSDKKGNKSNDEVNIESNKIYAELQGINNELVKGLLPIKILLNESILNSAVYSIKDSHLVVKSLGKELVVEILKDPMSKSKLGEWLCYLFSFESVRSPTRWLIYWSLQSKDVNQQCLSLALIQINYWLYVKEGKSVTVPLLTDQLNHWLSNKENINEFVKPLLFWTLQQDHITDSLSDIISYALPHSQDVVVDAIIQQAKEALKSEEIRNVVKDGIIQYFKVISMENNKENSET